MMRLHSRNLIATRSLMIAMELRLPGSRRVSKGLASCARPHRMGMLSCTLLRVRLLSSSNACAAAAGRCRPLPVLPISSHLLEGCLMHHHKLSVLGRKNHFSVG